ncbi:hypothetical protein VTK73DRAFT_5060 [Phialemonium thermophilum]|uniref:Uncharacterized protein n=1 Tax=Phialemonium thermophilum TaxID=223376 RepID=A0ABR3WQG5_9PEZI
MFISAKLKYHIFTPARVGKDTALLVTWKDGQPELRYSLKREFAKGMHDKPAQRPTHILCKHMADQLLVIQPMVFTVSVVLATGTLKRYDTLEGILSVTPPDDGRQWELEWEDEVLDCPVFSEVSADGPRWEKIQTASSFNVQLTDASVRAGMQEPVKIHGGPREAIIK